MWSPIYLQKRKENKMKDRKEEYENRHDNVYDVGEKRERRVYTYNISYKHIVYRENSY